MPVFWKEDGMLVRDKDKTTILKLNARIVNSSNVDWIAWPVSGEPALFVQFVGGARYVYLGVSRQRAVAAANSPSTGEYINQKIKPNFKVRKLR